MMLMKVVVDFLSKTFEVIIKHRYYAMQVVVVVEEEG
jgi:hypothetical protein